MKVDKVGNITIYSVRDEDEKEGLLTQYQHWIGIGEFFYHLLIGSTPTISYTDIDNSVSDYNRVVSGVKLIPVKVLVSILGDIVCNKSSDQLKKLHEGLKDYMESQSDEGDMLVPT